MKNDEGAILEKDKDVLEPKVDTSGLDMLEQIAAQNDKVSAKEAVEVAEADGNEAPEWAQEILKEETEDVEVPEKDEATEDIEAKEIDDTKPTDEAENDETAETVEIIVDGEKRTVPLSDVTEAGVRALQKESAADKRLEEATKLLKEAKAQAPVVAPEPEVKPVGKQEVERLRTDYVRAIQYGSEEEAVQALGKWEEAVKLPASTKPADAPAPITSDSIRATIKQVELETMINKTPKDGGFSDLMDVPILRDQMASVVDTLVKTGKGAYDSFETYKIAGEAVRVMGAVIDPTYKVPVIDRASDDTFESKRNQKKKIINLESASKKLVVKKEKDGDENKSPSEIIDDMRKQRGQI